MSYKLRPWRSLSFEEEVWRAFENCISAGRIMETESIGTDGNSHFESRPSIEAFDVSVNILSSMMYGAGWIDESTKAKLDPKPIYAEKWVSNNGHSTYDNRYLSNYDRPVDGHMEKVQVSSEERNCYERFGVLVERMHQLPQLESYFRRKRPKWTVM